jgi:16S rRNA (cytidine1402-2'-O)-methyltransferase
MVAVLGADRRAVVCRELTKTYEEIARGTVAELAARFAADVRGEVTVVVEGAAAPLVESTPTELARLVAVREESGEPRKEAITGVARELGLAKREVYDAVVGAKRVDPAP